MALNLGINMVEMIDITKRKLQKMFLQKVEGWSSSNPEANVITYINTHRLEINEENGLRFLFISLYHRGQLSPETQERLQENIQNIVNNQAGGALQTNMVNRIMDSITVLRQDVDLYFLGIRSRLPPPKSDYSKLALLPDLLANKILLLSCQKIAEDFSKKFKNENKMIIQAFQDTHSQEPGVWMSWQGVRPSESEIGRHVLM